MIKRHLNREQAGQRVRTPAVTKGKMQVRVVGLAALVAVAFVVLIFRLWYLQVLTGENYSLSAQATHTRSVKIPAQRGVIYDRSGKVLANNSPGLSVTVVPASIVRDKVKELADILGADEGVVLGLYDAAVKAGPGTSNSPILVKENAGKDAVTYISERSEEFPGVAVNDDYIRNYPNGEMASHVLGYTGAVTQEELKQPLFQGLPNDAVVGKSGEELEYEKYLRGTPGSKEYNVDALGRVVSHSPGAPDLPSKVVEPVPGKDLKLTIDVNLQKTAEAELDAAIKRAQGRGYAGTGGSVIAMDPRTGQILAMASRPSFDPQLFVGGISGASEMREYEYLNSKAANSPFTNRSISGSYPAASTFKVFTGIAGLATHAITPQTTVTDNGACWRPAGVTTGCWQSWREYDKTGTTHGTQNYAQSLMDSNDKFFYQVSDWMWNRTNNPDELPEYDMKFGFGKPTGIDLPGEASGRVPTREWQEKTGQTPEDKLWSVGRWVNLSIGQGDLLVTPVQLIRGYAAIENGGTLVTPHVGLDVQDQNGRVVKSLDPPPAGKLDVDPQYLQDTIKGLEMVTGPKGTAERAFIGSRIKVVGKTGTGQMGDGKDPVGWFVGWAENQKNPLVVLVMVEHGGDGEPTSAPAVRHILEAYYGVKQSPEDVYATKPASAG